MSRFEDGVTRDVIDISSRRYPDSAHLRGQCIAQVIAVQIERRNHIEIFRTRQYLLKSDIGNRVFDYDARARFAHGNFAPGTPSNSSAPKYFLATSKPQSRN